MSKNVLLGLIVVTAAVFAFVYGIVQLYPLAAVAVGLGIVWAALELRTLELRAMNLFGVVSTVAFVAFVALAAGASLKQAPAPLVLLGLSTALAAWDVARFRVRIGSDVEAEPLAKLESDHLRKLAITISAGFLIALMPLAIQISLNFVVLLLLILIAVVALRRSMFYLRRDPARSK